MRYVVFALLVFLSVAFAAPAQVAGAGNYVLLRVPQADGTAVYEVITRDEYPARQAEARLREQAADQAYEEVKAAWAEVRKEEARQAIERARSERADQQRQDQRNNRSSTVRTRTSRVQQTFQMGTFPLPRPDAPAIGYLGTYLSEQDAKARAQGLLERDKFNERSSVSLQKTQLARPEGKRDAKSQEDKELVKLSNEFAARTEEILARLQSGQTQADARESGLNGGGLARPSTGKSSGTKRVGAGSLLSK